MGPQVPEIHINGKPRQTVNKQPSTTKQSQIVKSPALILVDVVYHSFIIVYCLFAITFYSFASLTKTYYKSAVGLLSIWAPLTIVFILGIFFYIYKAARAVVRGWTNLWMGLLLQLESIRGGFTKLAVLVRLHRHQPSDLDCLMREANKLRKMP
ncbi:hypothetical protein F4779DRAFT_615563 [Xylariaceae sp. FL0662B]|nr:hypothetical protein F4779DRAFT_615563 [Xylariaceae sp. FL0662B]